MKKILLFLFLAMPLMGFAQKSYVHIFHKDMSINTHEYYSLSGDVPESVSQYHSSNYYISLAKIMTLLGKEGFVFESHSMGSSKDSPEVVVMSRDASSASKIQSIKIEDEGEPYEVARYNLQGIPVKANEKGVQIIVFSNYTTKTVVVE